VKTRSSEDSLSMWLVTQSLTDASFQLINAGHLLVSLLQAYLSLHSWYTIIITSIFRSENRRSARWL
jgi:hypothetical protein